jgi:aspartokinase/homoserine dehydrogenase 1
VCWCLQEKHVETAKQLLGDGPDLVAFVSRLMDDVSNLKAMLQAICIGERILFYYC